MEVTNPHFLGFETDFLTIGKESRNRTVCTFVRLYTNNTVHRVNVNGFPGIMRLWTLESWLMESCDAAVDCAAQ